MLKSFPPSGHRADSVRSFLVQGLCGSPAFRPKQMAFAAMLFMLSFLGCGSDPEGSGGRDGFQGIGRNGDTQQAAAIPVQVAEVKRGDISVYLLQTTTIEAIRQVDIVGKVAGHVVKLQAEEGDHIKKGALLAELDEAELVIAHMQAKVQLQTDKSIFERSEKMLAEKLIAEEAYETARLSYESAKAAYEAARLQLEHTNIRSPIDGVVTMRNIEIGQRVNANEVLFQVADFNPLRARIYVPEKDMGRVFVGQHARITVESEPGREFSGVVRMISPIVDPASGTAKVTIDISDAINKLKPGMFATVYISTETHENTLLIPKKALIIESEEDQVYVYEEGIAKKVKLELGFASGETVEVLSGLHEGDRVVTVGQEGLRTGLPIRVPGEPATFTSSSPDSAGTVGTMAGNGPQERPGGRGDFGGSPDPERLKRMEERMLQNPDIKAEYDKRVKADPDFKNNPEKKMAFFREMFRKMRGGQGGGAGRR